ncbi:hypothetical protein RchiOBHm_Chr6g0289471 [Rosa chinensis]|uniref:Uncharacterized protein n=1 Tax=Rosa chinensis TaxID=74649 RepID=A0A2P6PVM2_ROSCH|nr:hypothetical protein RchiOBHm_Chr6g0289471 [Rosa chinensis]
MTFCLQSFQRVESRAVTRRICCAVGVFNPCPYSSSRTRSCSRVGFHRELGG